MSGPVRVQLRRARGWRMPENTVVVSRPGLLGNPFVVGKHGTRDQCIEMFRRMVSGLLIISRGNELYDAQAALVLRSVRCERAGPPSYGRTVARCRGLSSADTPIDLGEALVRAGMAWDTPYSGGAYADAEREARAAGRGVWGWRCVRAEVWREERRQ